MSNDLMEKIVSLCKRRGFIFPGSEIYGGLANSWDYGPLGVELKNNIKHAWWNRFVHRRDDMVGLDAALIMNPKVWEASGHLKEFSDPLVECKKCHERFRADQIGFTDANSEADKMNISCPSCGKKDWSTAKQFNLMLKTFLGPAEEKASEVYFRPEIAQSMFVNFKQVLDTTRKKLPFGIASQGKAFRNEITPGNFIFRTREFDLMEFEYFVRPPKAESRTNPSTQLGASADLTPRRSSGQARNDAEQEEWEKWFKYWRSEMIQWMRDDLGLKIVIYENGKINDAESTVHEIEIPEGERAHYSKRTVDFEYDYPFGQKELYGLAYRTDFDLKNHEKFSGQNLKYKDPDTGEEFWPHVIEPTFGLDRSVLVTLLEAYHEGDDLSTPLDKTRDKKLGTNRIVLKLPPKLAPYKAAVFPLLANKLELVKKAREVYELLAHSTSSGHAISAIAPVAWDERGNIGKRYYAQDEIGTPFCITIDFESLEKNDVTVRDRDTMKQERIKISNLDDYLKNLVQ